MVLAQVMQNLIFHGVCDRVSEVAIRPVAPRGPNGYVRFRLDPHGPGSYGEDFDTRCLWCFVVFRRLLASFPTLPALS